jgi:hypothetical protein
VLIAGGLVWLATLSIDGSSNPFLTGSLFLFICFIFFGIHFSQRQAALSTNFWENNPKLEAFKFCIFSLPCFYSAYEAWTGIDLFPSSRKPSIALYYADLIGKIPITLLFIGLGFLMLYFAYSTYKRIK